MQITWHGHSCFTLDTGLGTVVLDPYEDGTVPGLPPLRLSAEMVLCSHGHPDHSAIQCVQLTGGGAEFSFREIPSFHDGEFGALRGRNTMYAITADDFTVLHCGDLGQMPSPAQYEAMGSPDVLLIPVGGHYTIDPAQAREIALRTGARVVIPMHYRGEGFGYDVLATVQDYTALCSDVVFAESNTVTVDKRTAPQTLVLKCTCEK